MVDAKDRLIREVEVATEAAALTEALSGLGSVHVVVESGPLAEWLVSVFEQAGHEAVIVDARTAKRLMSTTKKTDRRDARTLARMAHTGWYTVVHRKSADARLRRSRLQARQGLVRQRQAANAQVRELLRAHGVRLGRVSKGEFSERARARAAEALPDLVDALEPMLVLHDQALREAERLKRTLEREGRREPLARQLQSVPGIGPLVSQAYIATIDDPRRFANGDQLADYVGLVPSIHQSGEVRYQGRISREGDRLLRWHLVEAAHALLTWGPDCALKRWGQRLAERKGSAKAKVALARKLAILLRRLWLTGETFEPWPNATAA